MKKVSCKGRNAVICHVQNNPFTLFSGTLFALLFVLSIAALQFARSHTFYAKSLHSAVLMNKTS